MSASDVPRLLVVSSCSAIKRFAIPNPPGFDDLVDPGRRAKVEQRLAQYALPARDQYVGRQHRAVLRGVDRLRANDTPVDLAIVSAGYGLLEERQRIVPYEARFSGTARGVSLRRARQLRIHPDLTARLAKYEAAVFLLSDAYLSAVEAPILAAPLEIYLASPFCELEGPGVIHVHVGVAEARRLRDSSRTAKGTLFARFADAIVDRGWQPALDDLRSGALLDRAPATTTPQQPLPIAV